MYKKIAAAGWVLLAVIIAMAVLAPYNPYSNLFQTYLKPSTEHFLGTKLAPGWNHLDNMLNT